MKGFIHKPIATVMMYSHSSTAEKFRPDCDVSVHCHGSDKHGASRHLFLL
jgi:hypothetical protein